MRRTFRSGRATRPVLLTLLLAAGTASCRHRNDTAVAAAACESATPQAAAEMDVQQMNGSYAVTFVASEGSKTGRSVRGRLVLRAQDQSLVRIPFADTSVAVSQPVIGTLDLQTDSVGATRMGDPMSADAATPGVGVYVNSTRSTSL